MINTSHSPQSTHLHVAYQTPLELVQLSFLPHSCLGILSLLSWQFPVYPFYPEEHINILGEVDKVHIGVHVRGKVVCTCKELDNEPHSMRTAHCAVHGEMHQRQGKAS